jgi:hypothetical protein
MNPITGKEPNARMASAKRAQSRLSEMQMTM